ncbi:Flp family type IVb pilin [Paenisporosarcina quisquiliarum]|uniref:Flp family type IVb pilin n=1 Tax=Paenisporosarcina quisquiliarum TaxID=365346 RepID=UPI003734C292
MTQWIKNFMNEEEGQGMAEYALVLGIIAIGVVGLLVLFGDAIVAQFRKVTAAFTDETAPE